MDDNGTIDYNEFLTAAYNKEQLLCDENLDQAFKKIDEDQKGFLTQKSIQKAFGINKREIDAFW